MKTNYRRQHNHRRHFSRSLLIALIISLAIAALSMSGFLTSIVQNTSTSVMAMIGNVDTGVAQALTIGTPKSKLVKENQSLRSTIQKLEIQAMHSKALLVENADLRSLLHASVALQDRLNDANIQSHTLRVIDYSEIPYGTLLAQKDKNQKIRIGDLAHFGTWAIGTVVEINNNAVLIKLFTSSNDAYDVLIGDVKGTLIGTSNGTGKILLPRGDKVEIGTPVVLPLARGLILGSIANITREEEQSLQTLHMNTPFNINTVRFITISNE